MTTEAKQQPTTTAERPREAQTGSVGEQTQVARVFDAAQIGLPTMPVTDASTASQALAAARAARCHVLGPLTIGNIPPGYEVAFRVVCFREEDYYEPERNSGKFAHLKHALDLLLATAGGSAVPQECRRIDDRSREYLWEYQAAVRVPTFDGLNRVVPKTKVLDLRDGSPEAEEAMGMASDPPEKRARKLRDKRKNGPANCETKAMNRAIRAALGLRQSYQAAERFRPFVCPVLVYRPDMANPETRRMADAVHFGLADLVYGDRSKAIAAIAPPVPDVVERVIDVEAEPAAVVPPAAPAPPAKPASTQPAKPARVAAHPDDATPRRTTHAAEVHDAQASGGFVPACDECGAEVDDRTASLSTDTYGRILCREHQEEASS